MPDIELTLSKLLNDYVKPVFEDNPAALAAFNAFVGAIQSFLSTKIEIPVPDSLIPSPGSGGDNGGGDSDAGWPPSGLPGIPALNPIDPQDVMKAVARAVREAEKILNAENLAIGGAGIDISFVVQVAGIAGANANLKITIGPTPRA